MKSCSYCGKQYPDDATICIVDGQDLSVPQERKSVAGVWRGVYGYKDEKQTNDKIVSFTLKLKQKWFGNFSGTVTEDAPAGIPGVGTIDGGLTWPAIEFSKQMPVGYVTQPDGSRVTMREYLTSKGYECLGDPPAPPIFYRGTFLDLSRVQGFWIIKPRQIPIRGGSITSSGNEGVWCAQFITADMNANPTDSPKQPFFQKEIPPDEEIPENIRGGFCRLGKFRVQDAEHYLRRFEAENIPFEINRDDTAMKQMTPFTAVTGGFAGNAPMIEIFVRQQDKERGMAIVNEDVKL